MNVRYRRPQPSRNKACWFHVRGNCKFGDNCKNRHLDPGYFSQERSVVKKSPNEGNVSSPPKLTIFETNNQKKKDTTEINPSTSSTNNQEQKNTTEINPGTSSTNNQEKKDLTEINPSTSSVDGACAIIISKTCGICFDEIMEKTEESERTYGILPNCNHCYCFLCIKKWRQTKEFDFDVSKACPECRTPSDYVYPSKVWFEIKEDKDLFISRHKTRMQKKHCTFFRRGAGSCPFGNTCLFLHALPNGKKMDVGPPKPRKPRARNLDTETLHQILFWLNEDELEIFDDDDEDEDVDYDIDFDDSDTVHMFNSNLQQYLSTVDTLLGGDSDIDSDESYPLLLY